MATNYAKASYTEIYDVQTAPSCPTVLGVHTPNIANPYRMLGGFFKQFAKFRYAGCDITFVPVSTMPLDPLQVGTEAGKTAPQDVVNPILHKAFMGESLGSFFDTYFPQAGLGSVDYSNSQTTAIAAAFDDIYFQALSDQRFLKSGIQSGFKRDGLVPLVRRVNTNYQFGPYADRDTLNADERLPESVHDVDINNFDGLVHAFQEVNQVNSNAAFETVYPAMFSSGAYPLDWLDTIAKVGFTGTTADNIVPAAAQGYAWLPKLYMYFIMLPPSFNTVMYFRLVIRHRFEFKDFQCMVPFGDHTDIDEDNRYTIGLPRTNGPA